jgi:hypothetical protein
MLLLSFQIKDRFVLIVAFFPPRNVAWLEIVLNALVA